MSYTPKYTSEVLVEQLTQMNITTSSDPNSDEVLDWIEEVEKEIDAKKLGWGDGRTAGQGYLASNVYLDVPSHIPKIRPIREWELITKNIDPYFLAKGFLITIEQTHLYPIIPDQSVTLARNKASELDDAPEWETLARGYYSGWTEAADTDYLIITSKGRAGQEHGTAFFIYSDKKPNAGLAQLKATFSYGWNLPKHILQRYATLRVGIKVLEAAVEAGEPTRIASFTGGDFQTFVNTQLDATLTRWRDEAKRIERKYFPIEARAKLLWL